MSYNRAGGANDELVAGTIPTSPATGYSHVYMTDLGYAEADVLETRYYCWSSYTGRVMSFKTSHAIPRRMQWNGDGTGVTASVWSNNFVTLGGHDANLPAATTSAANSITDHMIYVPSTYHWNIRSGGDRYECDASPTSQGHAGNAYSTQHLIYVRLGTSPS
jgi:hypothetical protein